MKNNAILSLSVFLLHARYGPLFVIPLYDSRNKNDDGPIKSAHYIAIKENRFNKLIGPYTKCWYPLGRFSAVSGPLLQCLLGVCWTVCAGGGGCRGWMQTEGGKVEVCGSRLNWNAKESRMSWNAKESRMSWNAKESRLSWNAKESRRTSARHPRYCGTVCK